MDRQSAEKGRVNWQWTVSESVCAFDSNLCPPLHFSVSLFLNTKLHCFLLFFCYCPLQIELWSTAICFIQVDVVSIEISPCTTTSAFFVCSIEAISAYRLRTTVYGCWRSAAQSAAHIQKHSNGPRTDCTTHTHFKAIEQTTFASKHTHTQKAMDGNLKGRGGLHLKLLLK